MGDQLCPGSVIPDSPESPDGTEGYASITLNLKDLDHKRHQIQTNGCFVKNDEHLKNLQSTEYKKTHRETKFFVYCYCSESNLSNRLVKSEIVAYRFTKPFNKDKVFTIKNKEDTQFFLRDNHVFLPVCHKYLKTNAFPLFLENYSKAVTLIGNLLVGNYKGVEIRKLSRRANQNSDAPGECPFSLSMSKNNTLNITKPADSTFFQNLVDGPLLFKEASKRWRLIGWYKKAPEGERITVYHLGTQDTTDIWKTSSSNQTDGILSNQPTPDSPSGSATSTDLANQSGSATSTDLANQSGSATSTDLATQSESATSTDLANQSGSTNPSTSTSAQANPSRLSGSSISTNSHPIPPGSDTSFNNYQVVDLMEKDEKLLDKICSMLYQYSPIIKNWERLATQLDAPPSIIARLKRPTQHSQTRALFDTMSSLSKTEKLTVQKLITLLDKDGLRRDVVDLLEKKIPENERQQGKVTEKVMSDEALMEELETLLDKESKVVKNWYHIGLRLGLPKETLQEIKDGDYQKTIGRLFAYIYSKHPKLTVEQFKEIMVKIDRKDVLNKLSDVSEGLMKTSIPLYTGKMYSIWYLLSKNTAGVKDWKHLARQLNIDDAQCKNFEKENPESPTKLLLEWALIEEPGMTVSDLCVKLRNIERNDVIWEIEEFYGHSFIQS